MHLHYVNTLETTRHQAMGTFYNNSRITKETLIRHQEYIFMYCWQRIWIQSCKKTNLMHNLFLVYFVNICIFLAYLCPSSGGTTVCIQKLALIILFRWLLSWRRNSHLKRIISTNYFIHMVVPPDDGHRYAQNMQMLTKYTKNKLCINLVFLYTRNIIKNVSFFAVDVCSHVHTHSSFDVNRTVLCPSH